MRGASYLLRGLGLWRTRPRVMAWGLLPALLVLLMLAAALVGLVVVADDLAAWATSFAEGWSEGLRRGVARIVGRPAGRGSHQPRSRHSASFGRSSPSRPSSP